MNKRLLPLAGALAAGAAATFVALPAGAGGAPTMLHFLDVSVGATPAFDAGHGAPRAGDRVYLRDALYTWNGAKRGDRAGHVEATLTFMSAFGRSGAAVDITGQVLLAGGSLRVEGIARVTTGLSRFALPVVGGTGIYAGARGELHVRDLAPRGDKSAFDLRLLP